MSEAERIQGITFVELLIVLAFLGVITGVGISRLNPAGAATSQAAQVVASSVARARFEAVKTNSTSGLEIMAAADGSSGTITICHDIDWAAGLTCAFGATTEVKSFDGGELARAIIASPGTTAIYFDRRGVVRNPAKHEITITDRSGRNSRTVSVSATGRAEVH